jgi:hypothetical protein
MLAPQHILTKGVCKPTSPPRDDLEGGATGGVYRTDAVPCESSTDSKQVPEALPQEAATMDGCKHKLEAPLQRVLAVRRHRRISLMQEDKDTAECPVRCHAIGT